jgi:membrane protein involved in colicin uptake
MAKKPVYATRRIEHGEVVSGKNSFFVFEEGDEVKGISPDALAALGTAVTDTPPAAKAEDEDAADKAAADKAAADKAAADKAAADKAAADKAAADKAAGK